MNPQGFDLERTSIRPAARLERLFGLMILFWVACLRLGVWLEGQRPINVEGHGRQALSWVRYGSETLGNVLRWNSGRLGMLAAELIQPVPALGATSPSCPVLNGDGRA